MLLISLRSSTPGRRTRPRAAYGFQHVPQHPRLSCGYINTAGRGLSGSRTLRTKGSRATTPKFRNLFAVTAGFFTLATVAYWAPRALKGGAVMVLRSATGAWFSAPAALGATPLCYIQAVPATLEAQTGLNPQPHWWRQLRAVLPYTRVSGVATEASRPAQLARAVGSTCQVLIPLATGNWSLLALPSGQLRLVDSTAYVMQGAAHPASLKYFTMVSAGQSRRLGRRPLVRGTVKNPNDHPHGGRTRAVRYPRTPWGRTAKLSRSPRALPKLKALVKRRRNDYTKPLPYWAQHGAPESTPADTPTPEEAE